MSEKKLLDSLLEIQRDLSTVIKKMKTLSLNDTFVTHCDFILSNMPLLKAMSALKIAVQSYNVYRETSANDVNDTGLIDDSGMDDVVDDNDDANFENVVASINETEEIKQEKDDDADYDPTEGYGKKRGRKTSTKKTKKGGAAKTKKRDTANSRKSQRISNSKNDPSVQIEYRWRVCFHRRPKNYETPFTSRSPESTPFSTNRFT